MYKPGFVSLILVILVAHLAVGSSRRHSRGNKATITGYEGAVNVCPTCDVRKCPTLSADDCDGQIVKDECNCCPVCDIEENPEDLFITPTAPTNNNSCAEVQCPRNEVCIVNIQNIPMCRCPSPYWCKMGSKRPLCSEDGVSYKSRCYLKIDECTTGKKVKVRHRGNCQEAESTETPPLKSRQEKMREREERRKERKKEKLESRRRNRQNKKADDDMLSPKLDKLAKKEKLQQKLEKMQKRMEKLEGDSKDKGGTKQRKSKAERRQERKEAQLLQKEERKAERRRYKRRYRVGRKNAQTV